MNFNPNKIAIMGALMLSLSTYSFAQNGAVTNAIFYQRDSNYVKAKEEIDKAVVHEKTQNSPKAWYTKGEIYEGIALSNKKEIKTLDSNAVFSALEAYQKSISFDKPNGAYAKQSQQRLENVWVILVNTGINKYQNRKFDNALIYFSKAQEIKPNDTTAYVYATFATEAKGDLQGSNTLFEQLLKLNYKSVAMYHILNRYAAEVEKNYEKAIDYINKGKAFYPNEIVFITDEFNVYLSQGKSELAKQKLEEAVQKDSNNSLLFFNLGVINEQIGSKEKAAEYYQKAIDINPNNTDALFNLGAYHYHKAAALYEQANKLPFKDYATKGKELEGKGNELFKISMPYFEKVYSINKEGQTKKILYDIYSKLKLQDKIDQLMK